MGKYSETGCDVARADTARRHGGLSRGTSVMALLAASLLLTEAAHAQDKPRDAEASAASDDIVVTARRREESLARVPVAVTALSAKMLEEAGIKDERDLQFIAPGLQVKTSQTGNQLNFALRGQTMDAISGSQPGVNVYLNEVALPGNVESANGLYDMSSVQVLKGPQGTLFGRNATGGSVLYTTRRPGDEFTGSVSMEVGNYDMRQVRAAVDLPIVPGKVDVRVAGIYIGYDGYVTNLTDGKHPGTTDYKSGRITVSLHPSDVLTNDLVVQYAKTGGVEFFNTLYSVYSPGQINGGQPLNSFAFDVTGGAILNYLNTVQKPQGLYTLSTAFPSGPHRNRSWHAQNTTTFNLNEDTQIKNIMGGSTSKTLESTNNTGAPFLVLNLLNPADCCDGFRFNQKNWSEELQLSGKAGDLKYIVGAYHAYASQYNFFPVLFVNTYLQYEYQTKSWTTGLFGQGTYDLANLTGISGLSTTIGYRHTWDKLGNYQGAAGLFPTGPDQSHKENDYSYQAGLEYQATPQALLYVVHRRSWRSGGYTNQSPANDSNRFGPEQTHDIELGFKFDGDIAGSRARMNIALYNQVTKNVQKNIYVTVGGVPSSSTLNVPEQKTKGVEFDSQVKLTDWLDVGSNVTYTDAKFNKPTVSLLGVPTALTNVADTPKWTGSAFIRLGLPVPQEWGSLSFRAQTYSQSTSYFSSFYFAQVPGTKIPGYTLLNLRLEWSEMFGSNVSLAGYMRNAFDRKFIVGGLPTGATIGLNTAVPGAPRKFGMEATINF